jgi:hypothetical protein
VKFEYVVSIWDNQLQLSQITKKPTNKKSSGLILFKTPYSKALNLSSHTISRMFSTLFFICISIWKIMKSIKLLEKHFDHQTHVSNEFSQLEVFKNAQANTQDA